MIEPIDCQCKHILRSQWKATGQNDLVYASQNVLVIVFVGDINTQFTLKISFSMMYSGT